MAFDKWYLNIPSQNKMEQTAVCTVTNDSIVPVEYLHLWQHEVWT